jgi:enoyl-CoA hydratase/carnithine racemase
MSASQEHRVKVEKRGHVLLMGLDRAAKRNAFDLPMFDQLATAYTTLEDDAELRCGVLHALGEHFTGGLDLGKVAPVFAAGTWPVPDGAVDPVGLYGRVRTKPVVVAVQGICFTIGIELMLACDVRVAARGTRFGQIEVKRGIYPFGGATFRFLRETGWGNAMRWLLTGDEFDAEEARRIGLVQEVVDDGAQLERALQLASTIAAQAPLGVRATLKHGRAAHAADEAQLARRLLEDLPAVMASDDAREGLQSFLERRTAVFTGK